MVLEGMNMKVVVLKLPKNVPPPDGYVLVKELRKENVYNAFIQVPKRVTKKSIEDNLSNLFRGFGLEDKAEVNVAEDHDELSSLLEKMSMTRHPSKGGSRQKTRKHHKK